MIQPQHVSNEIAVCAVVVSFNRRNLLEKVLEGLWSQSRAVQRIIVVDNGSSDGTREWLRTLDKSLHVIVLAGANGGGAGGFARGIARAADLEYDLAWLMDDDAIPDVDCLAALVAPHEEFPDTVLTAPRVVDEAGNTGPRNFPVLDDSAPRFYESVPRGWIPVRATTFVGPLISINAARKTHLPLCDFFIWHDDIEYTQRIIARRRAYSITSARITHLANNPGPGQYNAGRNFYNVRNMIWWWRETDRRTGAYARIQILAALWGIVRQQFSVAPNKLEFIPILIRAMRAGIVSRPRHTTFSEMIERSNSEDEVVYERPAAHWR